MIAQYSNNKLETVLYTYMQQRKKMEEKEKSPCTQMAIRFSVEMKIENKN